MHPTLSAGSCVITNNWFCDHLRLADNTAWKLMSSRRENKDFALSLASKWRLRWTRKWPIRNVSFFLSLCGGNFTLINLFDAEFLCLTSSREEHFSFFKLFINLYTPSQSSPFSRVSLLHLSWSKEGKKRVPGNEVLSLQDKTHGT